MSARGDKRSGAAKHEETYFRAGEQNQVPTDSCLSLSCPDSRVIVIAGAIHSTHQDARSLKRTLIRPRDARQKVTGKKWGVSQ